MPYDIEDRLSPTPNMIQTPKPMFPPVTPSPKRQPSGTERELQSAGDIHILILDDGPTHLRRHPGGVVQRDFAVDVVTDPMLVESALSGPTSYHLIVLDYVFARPGHGASLWLDSRPPTGREHRRRHRLPVGRQRDQLSAGEDLRYEQRRCGRSYSPAVSPRGLAAFANRAPSASFSASSRHPQKASFQAAVHDLAKLLDLTRLGQVNRGLRPQTVDRAVDRRVAGDDDDVRVRLAVANPAKDLLRVQAGQHVVQNDQVIGGRAGESRFHQHRVGHHVHREVAVGQRRLDDGAGVLVVVQNENVNVTRRLQFSLGAEGWRFGDGVTGGNIGLGVWIMLGVGERRSSMS